jgi:uncharacterized protein (TIGR02145 family)
VGINSTGDAPNSKAILDLSSTTKGFLPPRMTFSERTAITSPPAGLMVWCSNCGVYGELQVYNGTIWTNLTGGAVSGSPGAPTIGTATAGNAQASVSFTPPASNGGLTITSYTATSDPGNITGILNQSGSGTITVTGLTNGTAYTFTVTATNATGTGAASAASNPVTPATVPGVPTIGTATAGNQQASVPFTAPSSNGGSTIISYTATSSPGGITGILSQAGSGTITVAGLTISTTYTFTVTATNAVGTGAVSAASNAITIPFVCGSNSLTDIRDGKVYNTVQIGTQCWVAKNLAYLPSVVSPFIGSETEPYYYVYDYVGTVVAEAKAAANYQTYGVLYNWTSSLTACPTGWHLPTNAEWTTLRTYVFSQSGFWCGGGYIAKALAAKTDWNTDDGECTVGNNLADNNATGFSGLPGGSRSAFETGSFSGIGLDGIFWSTTESSATYAWYRGLQYSDASFTPPYLGHPKGDGYSVRCVRD